MNPNRFPSEGPPVNAAAPAIRCTSKPDCGCESCTVTRFQPTEEDTLALDFISKLESKGK